MESVRTGSPPEPNRPYTRFDNSPLARYVQRIALSAHSIERYDGRRVTYRYRGSRSGQIKRCTLAATTFVARFLQHVLPRGFLGKTLNRYLLHAPGRPSSRAFNESWPLS